MSTKGRMRPLATAWCCGTSRDLPLFRALPSFDHPHPFLRLLGSRRGDVPAERLAGLAEIPREGHGRKETKRPFTMDRFDDPPSPPVLYEEGGEGPPCRRRTGSSGRLLPVLDLQLSYRPEHPVLPRPVRPEELCQRRNPDEGQPPSVSTKATLSPSLIPCFLRIPA